MIEATFILGTFFLVWMIQTATTKQLRKMKRLDRMFKQYEQSGLTILEFCKKKGMQRSKFYYWKKRYDEQKEVGLIDRRKGISYKVTKDKRKFITQYKINNPLASSKDIANKFKQKFGMKIHFNRVIQILQEENLNDPRGRKTGKPIKKTRK